MKRSFRFRQSLLARPAVAGAVVGVALVGATLGATLGGVASAQTPTPPAGQNPATTFIQRLAQHLGLPQDRVTQALQDTRNDALNDAVAAGRLTQEQADQIRNQPIDQGRGFGFGFGGRGGHGLGKLGGRGFGVSLDTVAQRLGLTQEDLRTQLQSGQSLAQIAHARGIDPQPLINQLVADAEAQLTQAVQNGRLTQAQADQMRQTLPDRIRQKVEAQHTPGERGLRPEGRQQPGQAAPSSATPNPSVQ